MLVPVKKDENEAIGRSKGGLTTKIHTTVDALGNPTNFLLTPGQAHDLDGADQLLPQMKSQTVLADKAGEPRQERLVRAHRDRARRATERWG